MLASIAVRARATGAEAAAAWQEPGTAELPPSHGTPLRAKRPRAPQQRTALETNRERKWFPSGCSNGPAWSGSINDSRAVLRRA
jgi:hypothetical protein